MIRRTRRVGPPRCRPPLAVPLGVAGLAVACVLAGCAASAPPADAGGAPAAQPTQPVLGTPPGDPELTTRLVAGATTGSSEVGTFRAEPGDLWVGGRCAGGDLELHVAPVAVLPVPCERLGGVPFLNRIVMRRPTEVTVSVTAPQTVTWNLRVEQESG